VVGRLEQPQAPARILPGGVHVDQDRDDLALGVGVDASVLRAALAANRDGGRTPGEVEAEFLLERLAKLVALQFVEELAERGAKGELRDRKAPALGNLWIVGVDLGAPVGANKARNDEILE